MLFNVTNISLILLKYADYWTSGMMCDAYLDGILACVNRRSDTVADSALLRFLENAKPTCEKRRSTEAEDAGHPRYWRQGQHQR